MAVPAELFEMAKTIATASGVYLGLHTAVQTAKEWFVEECKVCHAAGTVTCRRCKGTKTTRQRPVRLVQNSRGSKLLLSHVHDVNACFECGDVCLYDVDPGDQSLMQRKKETGLYNQNAPRAIAGQLLKTVPEPTSGMIWCPACHGGKFTYNMGLDLSRLFGSRRRPYWTEMADGIRGQPMAPCMPDKSEILRTTRRVPALMEYPSHPKPLSGRQIEFPPIRVNGQFVEPSLKVIYPPKETLDEYAQRWHRTCKRKNRPWRLRYLAKFGRRDRIHGLGHPEQWP